jgi:hypothetical protein
VVWIAVIAPALVAIAIALFALRRVTPGPSLVGRTVVIHTKRPDDRTLKGVLHAQYVDRWVLRDAVLMAAGGREIALGGIEHVQTGAISFVQEIEPDEVTQPQPQPLRRVS